MMQIEEHRKKVEAVETLEILKSDAEKYGERNWYLQLRKPEKVKMKSISQAINGN
jgi:hypothetical protein